MQIERRQKLWKVIRIVDAVLLALVIGACVKGITGTATGTSARPAPVVRQRTEVSLDAASAFAIEGVQGAMVALSVPDETLHVFGEHARDAYLPASTFKVANSLIALETSVAPDVNFRLLWDGVDRGNPEWNRDLTLREAFRESAYWYYAEIARRVGQERMDSWMERLDYGNKSTAGGVDRFWIDGGLRVTPEQQIDFLRRLHERRLNVSERSAATVEEIMTWPTEHAYVLRGKTGWAQPQNAPEHGWFVGWAEREDRTIYFATIVIDPPPGKMRASRRAVSERVLDQLFATQ